MSSFRSIGDDVAKYGVEFALMTIEYRAAGTPAKLTIERADKQLTLQVIVEAAP